MIGQQLKLPEPELILMRNSMKKQGLFLDFDGTIANSIPALVEIYYGFLAEFGYQGSEDEFARLNGPPLDEVIAFLKQSYDLPISESELKANYMRQVNRIYQEVQPILGTLKVLQHAKKNFYSIAIVSSNHRSLISDWLEQHNLIEYIDFIIDAKQSSQGKPHPAPYLAALKQASVQALDSIAVEDTETGASSALQAGIKTFLLNKQPSTTLKAHATPCESISSLAELIDELTP